MTSSMHRLPRQWRGLIAGSWRSLWLVSLLLVGPANARAALFEAESGVLTGGAAVSTARAGYSGSGYVTGFVGGTDQSVAIPITVAKAGNYLITFQYASEFGQKDTRVSINGSDVGESILPQTATFATVSGPVVALPAGASTVTIYADWGYYDIDAILVDYIPPTASAYEAEDGTLNGVTVATTRTGFSGTGYVTGFTDPGFSVTLTLNLALTGPHQVKLRYAAPNGAKLARLLIDNIDQGEVSLPATATWAWANGPQVQLSAGFHTLVVVSDWGYYDLDRVDVNFIPPAVGTQFEAEWGTLHGVASISTARAGYSGTGYVTGFTAPDASVDIPVNVAAAGLYRVTLRSASEFGDKNTRLSVNGTDYGEMTLPLSATFAAAVGPVVSLAKGLNLIRVTTDWGYYDVDRVDLAVVPAPTFQLAAKPVDPLAAPETVNLYQYLRCNFGRTILAGQTEQPTGTPEVENTYILSVTGKLPAIRVLDFLPFSAVGGWEDGSTDRAIHWYRDLGGVVSYQWHWFAPAGGFSFYTANTTFDITRAVDPTQPEYQLILADIDSVARQIGRLAAARVPILFRPLHEAEGGWFWWGAHGPGPARQLYHILQDRLTNYWGLHNIIWVWNSVNPAWYPGDASVDIVSWDTYRNPHDYALPPGTYLDLAALSGGHKVVTLAENGPIPDPDPLLATRTLPAWFNTWWGTYLLDATNAQQHLIAVYTNKNVTTLEELPDLHAATAVTLFATKNYAGVNLQLPPGSYPSAALTIRGVVGGQVGSLRVPRGYEVVLYAGDNFTGKSLRLTQDTAALTGKLSIGPVKSAKVNKTR